MSTYKLAVLSDDIDGSNGIRTFRCRIVETTDAGETFEGPIELHGLDGMALTARYGGDPTGFLLEKKPEMVARYQCVRDAGGNNPSLLGQQL